MNHCLAFDILHLPLADATVSTLYFVHSIDHIDDKERVICELSRVLKPGGRFVFSDVSVWFDDSPVSSWFRKAGLTWLANKYVIFRRRASLIKPPVTIEYYHSLAQKYQMRLVKAVCFLHPRAHGVWALLRLFSLELIPITGFYLELIDQWYLKHEAFRSWYRLAMQYAFVPFILDEIAREPIVKGSNQFIVIEKIR